MVKIYGISINPDLVIWMGNRITIFAFRRRARRGIKIYRYTEEQYRYGFETDNIKIIGLFFGYIKEQK